MFPVDELIRYLPDVAALGFATKYIAYSILTKDSNLELNPQKPPDFKVPLKLTIS